MTTTNHKNTHKVSIFDRVQTLLDEGRPSDALKLIDHPGQTSASMKNAQAVCLLRLGKVQEAISLLRDITFQGFVCIPSDTPVVYQANFITAMLMANHKDSIFDIIDRLDDRQHPAVAKIKATIEKWEKSLNTFQKLLYKMGIYPKKAILIDFPPGELE